MTASGLARQEPTLAGHILVVGAGAWATSARLVQLMPYSNPCRPQRFVSKRCLGSTCPGQEGGRVSPPSKGAHGPVAQSKEREVRRHHQLLTGVRKGPVGAGVPAPRTPHPALRPCRSATTRLRPRSPGVRAHTEPSARRVASGSICLLLRAVWASCVALAGSGEAPARTRAAASDSVTRASRGDTGEARPQGLPGTRAQLILGRGRVTHWAPSCPSTHGPSLPRVLGSG